MSREVSQNRQSARLASRYTRINDDDDDFFDKLVKYFERYTKFALPRDSIRCIQLSLKYFSTYLQYKEHVSTYFEVLFGVIEIFRITDSDLIQNTIEEYFLLILYHRNLLRVELEPPSLFRRSRKVNIYYTMFGLLKEFTNKSFIYQPGLFCDAFDAKTLLRYGVPFGIDDSDAAGFRNVMLKRILEGTKLAEFTDDDITQIHTLVSENYPELAEKRRLYFILQQIYIATLSDRQRKYNEKMECLTVIYESIQDPLITVSEVVRFFKLTLRSKYNEDSVKEFCKIFMELFPMSDSDIQPRALQHLSRCQLRNSLMLSKKLPHGVWRLKIPKTLQYYILLENGEDRYFKLHASYLVPKTRSTLDVRRSKRLKKSQE